MEGNIQISFSDMCAFVVPDFKCCQAAMGIWCHPRHLASLLTEGQLYLFPLIIIQILFSLTALSLSTLQYTQN